MNKIRFIFILTFIITLSVGATALFAEDHETGENDKYNKTISLSVDPIGFIFLGPSAQVEYTGLGAIGIYGGYQNIGLGNIEDLIGTDDITITGYALSGGVKYYLGYSTSYHDSLYIGLEYTYLSMKAEDEFDEYVDLTSNMFVGQVGRRWQWDIVFLDLCFGLGYATISTDMSQSFDSNDEKDLKDALEGMTYQLKFRVGIAF